MMWHVSFRKNSNCGANANVSYKYKYISNNTKDIRIGVIIYYTALLKTITLPLFSQYDYVILK